jgi:hypothetical protein
VRYCSREQTDFPNAQFQWNGKAGEEYHYPPGDEEGHPSGRDGNGNGVPLPEPVEPMP